MFAGNLSDNHYCPLYPTMSLLATLRALKGPKSRTNSKRNVACEFAYPESVL